MRRSIAVAVLAIAGVATGLAVTGGASGGPEGQMAQDRCVRGAWKMSNSASNALLQSLVNVPGLRISRGVITAAFPRDDTMRYGSTFFVIELAQGDLVLKAKGSFLTEAPWSTRGGNLILGRGTSEINYTEFKGIKDGRTVTVPGPPTITRRTPRGSTPYTCNSTTLRWRIPINDAQTLFRRVT
jgi:hypothetical protein